jgi:hypothetical protein
MLHLIDAALRRALVLGIPGLTSDDIGFDPPNQDWRQRVGVAGRLLINAYLVELRENRRLRTHDPRRGSDAAGGVTRTAAPYRVDCHYLLSAWSPAAAGQAVEPTLDEHQMLGAIIAALDAADPFVFARLFDGVALPPGTPAALVEHELPMTLMPGEGFPKFFEFWGTMGDDAPVKPVVHLVVTAPFFATPIAEGPPVTTIIADYRRIGAAGGEVLHEFGGGVGDSAAPLPDGRPAPIADAWVELFNVTGLRLRIGRTDADGRFQFGALPAGSYALRATSDRRGILLKNVLLPSPSGEYALIY